MVDNPSIHAAQLATHREFVHRIALALVTQEGDAEDVVQETWLAALRNPPAESGALASRGWLRRVVLNVVRQHHRATSRRRSREAAVARNDSQPDSTRTVERLESHEVLVQRVLALSDPLRTTIVMRYLEDLSAPDVADRMGVTVNTVHDRLRRALRLLRRDMDRSTGGDRSAWALALLPTSVFPKPVGVAGTAVGTSTLLGTLITMKFGIAVSLLILAAVFWSLRPEPPGVDQTATEVAQLDRPKVAPIPNSPEQNGALSNRQDAGSTEASAHGGGRHIVEAAVGREVPRCRPFGKVVDGDGRPLEGVSVVFFAWPRWSEGDSDREAEWIDAERSIRGFRLKTDRSGEFGLDAPLSSDECIWLELELDAYHTTEQVIYGGSRHSARQRLGPGEMDLGTFTLNRAGVVWGSVFDKHGAAVRGAEVSVERSYGTTPLPKSKTDEAGRYRIAHVPAGINGVRVKVQGFISPREVPTHVAADRDQHGPDFTLKVGPTLQGIVRDENGKPLPGAYLDCWPLETGLGWGLATGATSGADGRFVVYLHHNASHTLEVSLDGYDPIVADREEPYLPDTKDIDFVLTSAAIVELLVMDAETKKPIDSFDTVVTRSDSNGWTEWIPSYRKQEGGTVQVNARPGLDLVEIAAPGYRRREVFATSGLTKIFLRKGPELRGRLILGGEPVPHPRISVEKVTFNDHWWSTEAGTRVRTTGNTNGDFSLNLASGGKYRVEIHGASPTPLLLVPLNVPPKGVLDLGDLILPAPATVSGRVELPPGVPADGIAIHVFEVSRDPLALTDSRGSFTLELPPGLLSFSAEKEDLLKFDSGDVIRVDLAAGITNSVVLTIHPASLWCSVSVTVLDGGKPAPGLTVSFESDLEVHGWGWLGSTDENGQVAGRVQAMGPARMILAGPFGPTMEPKTDPVFFQYGVDQELTVEINAGHIEFVWATESDSPSGDESERDSSSSQLVSFGSSSYQLVGIELSRDGITGKVHWIEANVAIRKEIGGDPCDTLELGPLLPGDYSVRMMITREKDGMLATNSYQWPPPFRPQHAGSVLVEANQIATCRLGD